MPKKNKVKPTKLQRRTLEILRDNPDMPLGKAMISAGYSEITSSHPKQKLVDSRGVENALEEWKETLRGTGITEDKLAKKYAEWLDATKPVSARITSKDADSQTDDFIEVPDYQTQLKAGEMIREDFGLKGQQTVNNQMVFNVAIQEQRKKYDI
jgi:hypothetical protein